MSHRSAAPRRRLRHALAALALASGLSAGEGVAQNAPDAIGLRPAETDPLAPVEAQPAEPQPFPDTLPTPTHEPTPTQGGQANPAGPPLPDLKPYPGAQRLGLRGGPPALPQPTPTPDPSLAPPPAIDATPAASIAQNPEPPRPRRPTVDDNPFAPAGILVGDLKLTPSIEEDFGYASNPSELTSGAEGSGFETTELGLGAQSLWSRGDLRGTLRGGYTDYFALHSASAPYGSGDLADRIDVTRDLSLDADGRFTVSPETVSSLGISGVAITSTSEPLQATYGATLGGAATFGQFTFAAHGSLDRTAYQDATLSNGTLDRLSSDNFNDWGLRLRAAFRASPAFSPFIEAFLDDRRYDSSVDASGFQRSSTGYTASLGADLDVTRLITGELSAGYGARDYADPRLPRLSGAIANASLVWTPTPLTTVTAKAEAQLADTTIAFASGARATTYSLDVAHQLLRNLILGVTGTYEVNDYVGVSQRDATTTLAARAEYDLNRDVVLKASVTRNVFRSTAANSNYVNDVFLVGLKLQR